MSLEQGLRVLVRGGRLRSVSGRSTELRDGVADLSGKQIDIVLEVVGRDGTYARDEKIVTLYDTTGSGTIDAGVAPAK